MELTTVAVALEGVSWSDSELYAACVLHTLMGGGGSFSAGRLASLNTNVNAVLGVLTFALILSSDRPERLSVVILDRHSVARKQSPTYCLAVHPT